MSSERSIMDAIRRRQHDPLHEASFEVGGSRYSSAFGRYYKDGQQIERDEYFNAKPQASTSSSEDKPTEEVKNTVHDKFKDSASKLANAKTKSYKDGYVTTFSAGPELDDFVASIPEDYAQIKNVGNEERGSSVYSDNQGNTIWINREGDKSKVWFYNEPKHVKKIEKEAEKEIQKSNKDKDEELITKYRDGDYEAANQLVKKYEGLVRYIAKSYFAPGADIDDIAQEGLMAVYQAMDTYVPGKNKDFKQYAILAVKRNIMNFISKQNAQKNAAVNDADPYDSYDAQTKSTNLGNPEEEYANKENQKMVDDFIKKNLSDVEQQVLSLYLQGYKEREIMQELSLSNKGVQNAMMRVRKKIKAWQETKNESISTMPDVPALLESEIEVIDNSPQSQYERYLQKHRRMVLECYESIMRPALVNDGYPEDLLERIADNLAQHDDSKYNAEEWEAYQNYFYDHEKYPRCGEAFNAAWNHHQKCNKHHWNYWVLINDVDEPQVQALEMPFIYVVELLCDWHAAGKHYGNTAKEWYQKNGDKMILHDNTRFMIENYIDLLS